MCWLSRKPRPLYSDVTGSRRRMQSRKRSHTGAGIGYDTTLNNTLESFGASSSAILCLQIPLNGLYIDCTILFVRDKWSTHATTLDGRTACEITLWREPIYCTLNQPPAVHPGRKIPREDGCTYVQGWNAMANMMMFNEMTKENIQRGDRIITTRWE